jgi:hypothetical protein
LSALDGATTRSINRIINIRSDEGFRSRSSRALERTGRCACGRDTIFALDAGINTLLRAFGVKAGEELRLAFGNRICIVRLLRTAEEPGQQQYQKQPRQVDPMPSSAVSRIAGPGKNDHR